VSLPLPGRVFYMISQNIFTEKKKLKKMRKRRRRIRNFALSKKEIHLHNRPSCCHFGSPFIFAPCLLIFFSQIFYTFYLKKSFARIMRRMKRNEVKCKAGCETKLFTLFVHLKGK